MCQGLVLLNGNRFWLGQDGQKIFLISKSPDNTQKGGGIDRLSAFYFAQCSN